VVERLKPMPGWLRRYAELADRGLDLDEIAEQLMIKPETIRKRYDPAYRNYISLAKERVLEFYNQGMDLGEAAVKVRDELGLTDGMIAKALELAQGEIEGRVVRVLRELRREGEEASRRVLEHSVPLSPDEMLETITPTRRGNTLDPEVRNPALQRRGGS
jgi:DNA-directed RNA polymerase specialized sigma24 family protein